MAKQNIAATFIRGNEKNPKLEQDREYFWGNFMHFFLMVYRVRCFFQPSLLVTLPIGHCACCLISGSSFVFQVFAHIVCSQRFLFYYLSFKSYSYTHHSFSVMLTLSAPTPPQPVELPVFAHWLLSSLVKLQDSRLPALLIQVTPGLSSLCYIVYIFIQNQLCEYLNFGK